MWCLLKGFGDIGLGHLEAVELMEPVRVRVGGGKGETVGNVLSGEPELAPCTPNLGSPSAAAAEGACDQGEDGEPDRASVLGLVSTFFSRSSVIFLPAMLCVSKAAVRFSTTAARRCAVPFITPSLMFWAVWEILPRIRNFESP